jgi:hypothetical protein
VAIISETKDYNGFAQKIERLGLAGLVAEATSALNFPLLVKETKWANGTRGLRQIIDGRFEQLSGWRMVKVGGVDWTKANQQGGTIGVEVQVSGRSDMLAVDVLHLKEKLSTGFIDAGIIIVPDGVLSYFLTDRTPNVKTAIKHIEAGAKDQPIRVLAFRHDGPGPALGKMRTNLGRYPGDPPPARKVADPGHPPHEDDPTPEG